MRSRARRSERGALTRVRVEVQVEGLPEEVLDLAIEAAALRAGALRKKLVELGRQA